MNQSQPSLSRSPARSKRVVFLRSFWISLLIGVALIGSFNIAHSTEAPTPLPTARFEFGLIGDLPYSAEEEVKFSHLMSAMNQADLAFVIHDGDIKSGAALCSDAQFEQRKALFQTSAHPFVLVPGDNEWTDCHRESNGSYDPIERLAKLRSLFFSNNESLGQQTLRLTRQSDQPQYRQFRENIRWWQNNVLFVGMNVTGSNNNFGRTPEADAEYRERNTADLAWMQDSFALANQQQAAAVVLIIHGNPQFDLAADAPERLAFNDFIAALEAETLSFSPQPVVLVHGDSHYFRIDKPLMNSSSDRRIENFTRVETFGSPDVHWVRAIVDLSDTDLFQFEQEILDENQVNG